MTRPVEVDVYVSAATSSPVESFKEKTDPRIGLPFKSSFTILTPGLVFFTMSVLTLGLSVEGVPFS